jgi:predicted RNA-binding Zn-ribbon protein involved in translation (DUF1610 family)
MKKFCTNCGSGLASEDTFCSQCGVKISNQKKIDPTNLPEVEKRTLNNLKNGKTVKKFLCLECGYSGPAILVSRSYKWFLVGGIFFLSMVLVVIAPGTSTAGAIAIVWALLGTMTTIILCPRCENESKRTGFSLNR